MSEGGCKERGNMSTGSAVGGSSQLLPHCCPAAQSCLRQLRLPGRTGSCGARGYSKQAIRGRQQASDQGPPACAPCPCSSRASGSSHMPQPHITPTKTISKRSAAHLALVGAAPDAIRVARDPACRDLGFHARKLCSTNGRWPVSSVASQQASSLGSCSQQQPAAAGATGQAATPHAQQAGHTTRKRRPRQHTPAGPLTKFTHP